MLMMVNFKSENLSLSWFQCKAIALRFNIASLDVSNTEKTQ